MRGSQQLSVDIRSRKISNCEHDEISDVGGNKAYIIVFLVLWVLSG